MNFECIEQIKRLTFIRSSKVIPLAIHPRFKRKPEKSPEEPIKKTSHLHTWHCNNCGKTWETLWLGKGIHVEACECGSWDLELVSLKKKEE